MQNSRLFELLYLLLEHQQLTVRELAERLEVSERTVRRDVDALSAAGIPVYMAAGRGGGVRMMPGFTLDRSMLTAEEQEEILCALQMMRTAGLDGRGALSRLSGIFHRGDVPDWIAADFSNWAGDGETASFPILKQAILEHRLLTFDYYAASGEESHRTVEPVRLCFKGFSWYLQAWCRSREAYRFFKLSRMEQVRLADGFFDPHPAPPEPGEVALQVEMIPVTLRFSPDVAYRVYDEFDRKCITRRDDGSLIVRVLWAAGIAGCGYLLSYGCHAEILEPAAMRRIMREELQRTLRFYT